MQLANIRLEHQQGMQGKRVVNIQQKEGLSKTIQNIKLSQSFKKTQAKRLEHCVRSQESNKNQFSFNRRQGFLTGTQILLGQTLFQNFSAEAADKRWEQVETPAEKDIVFLDIAMFQNDPKRGFLLGTKQTLLETTNGGVTWEKKEVPDLQDDDINYRLSAISLSNDGKEGWIVGKPNLLLHTGDGGQTWQKKALSPKLPGAPYQIYALNEPGNVEMVTDQGAIYKSSDEAASWKAQVQETVDATLNRTSSSGISGASYYEGYFSAISRNDKGEYVAVSSRGNFYMTWQPGYTNWLPHNRPGGRRVQNMGWTPSESLWLTTKGGDVFCSQEDREKFDQAKITSRGFGILGIGFKDAQEGYACGGSGSLFVTEDGGKTWKRQRETDNVPGNFYSVKFFGQNNGYVLGNAGILLKYIA